jgi:hypothetical protein
MIPYNAPHYSGGFARTKNVIFVIVIVSYTKFVAIRQKVVCYNGIGRFATKTIRIVSRLKRRERAKAAKNSQLR